MKSSNFSESDFVNVARLHCDYINQGFLATLGVPFLTLLYKAIDKDKDSVLIVNKKGDDVIGFVTGTNGLGRIYKQLLMQPHLLIYSLKESLVSPKKVYKILEVLLMNKSEKTFNDLPDQELLSIVVSSNHQGGGHAENLFNALCNNFKVRGEKGFKIIVGISLDRAHAFYKKMGSIPIKKIQVHKGFDSIVYVKSL